MRCRCKKVRAVQSREKFLLVSCFLSLLCVFGCLGFDASGLSSADGSFSISLSSSDRLSIADSYGEISKRYSTIGFSNVESSDFGIAVLKEGGIVFNKTPINSILGIRVDFAENGFAGAKLYYGNHALPYVDFLDLSASGTYSIPEGNSFFTVRSTGMNEIVGLCVDYSCSSTFDNPSIPVVSIETELDEYGKHKEIESKEEYVDCVFDLADADNHLNDLTADAQIRLRGNSTFLAPKKPYRIKFEKKQSLFGLVKAKNWCLLADYMDGSYMHNFSALNFAHMVRGEEFTPTPTHVNVVLNGESIGMYLLVENPDEKKGRTDNEVEDSYILSLFDEEGNYDFGAMPFIVERDDHISGDPSQVLDETYFVVMQKNYQVYNYLIRYPEKENFYSYDDDGQAIFHSDEYYSFFNTTKAFITDLHDDVLRLAMGKVGAYESVESKISVDSLASYALTDMVFKERDHNTGSYKIYKKSGNDKVSFGPTWDYDSCTFGLSFKGRPHDTPYDSFLSHCTPWNDGDFFGMVFYTDGRGKARMSLLWNSISEEEMDLYLESLIDESARISLYLLDDVSIWQEKRFFVAFDNLRYYYEWLTCRIEYLNTVFV